MGLGCGELMERGGQFKGQWGVLWKPGLLCGAAEGASRLCLSLEVTGTQGPSPG